MNSITRCLSCDSPNITKDIPMESWQCEECGSSGYGDSFWE